MERIFPIQPQAMLSLRRKKQKAYAKYAAEHVYGISMNGHTLEITEPVPAE